jgi:Transglutaminase-like superfamily
MKRMVLESWLLLLYFDLITHQGAFKALHDTVRKNKINPSIRNISHSAEALCHAVDLACVFYFKPVMCLQRSATTVLLLRRYGWNAEMVIGAQGQSFRSHAWVEIAGTIVNDKPYMLDIYQVLERC